MKSELQKEKEPSQTRGGFSSSTWLSSPGSGAVLALLLSSAFLVSSLFSTGSTQAGDYQQNPSATASSQAQRVGQASPPSSEVDTQQLPPYVLQQLQEIKQMQSASSVPGGSSAQEEKGYKPQQVPFGASQGKTEGSQCSAGQPCAAGSGGTRSQQDIVEYLRSRGMIPPSGQSAGSTGRPAQAGGQGQVEQQIEVVAPEDTDNYESVEKVLNRMLLKVEEIDKIKRKAKIYRSHIEKEDIPKGRKREVTVPLDRPEITVNCHTHYGTIIELPEGTSISPADIALWDQKRFNVQIYGDRFILVQPQESFKATNMTVFLSKGNDVLHFLLLEDETAQSVDYHLVVKLVPKRPPTVDKIVKFVTGGGSIGQNDITLYGITASYRVKKVGPLRIIREITFRRPEPMKAFVFTIGGGVPDLSPSTLSFEGDVVYHGNIEGTNDYFVVFKGTGGNVIYGGTRITLR